MAIMVEDPEIIQIKDKADEDSYEALGLIPPANEQ